MFSVLFYYRKALFALISEDFPLLPEGSDSLAWALLPLRLFERSFPLLGQKLVKSKGWRGLQEDLATSLLPLEGLRLL